MIGTASAEKASHARSAGAAEIIDYKNEDLAARILDITEGTGVDAVVDMDFSTTVRLLSAGVLAPHGKYVCYGSNVPGDNAVPFGDLLFRSLTLQFFLVYELREDQRTAAVADLDTMLKSGGLAHLIGARFPLVEIAAAHETVEAGHLVGNVVLDLID